MPNPYLWMPVVSLLIFGSAFMLVRYGYLRGIAFVQAKERWFNDVLNHQLLMDLPPKTALLLSFLGMLIVGMLAGYFLSSLTAFFLFAAGAAFLPFAIVKHLQTKRRERLEEQIVDGITTLASGVRAGLNLIQAMELLVKNTIGPIKQEFDQLLREYQMGLDLNQAMRNSADRIGSGHYRLLFTAIEMHRLRGGDAGESLDRIAEAIRDIQRLEGKLDAVTSQGRTQAWMMAAMPVLLLGILYLIDADDVMLLFTTLMGKVMLLGAVALVVIAFLWIRKIMNVDI